MVWRRLFPHAADRWRMLRTRAADRWRMLKTYAIDLPKVGQTIGGILYGVWLISWFPASTRGWAIATGLTFGTVLLTLFAAGLLAALIYGMPWVITGREVFDKIPLGDLIRGTLFSAAVYYGCGIGVTLRLTDYHWAALSEYMRAHLLDPLAVAVFVSFGLVIGLGRINGISYLVTVAGGIGLAASFVAGGSLTMCLASLLAASFITFLFADDVLGESESNASSEHEGESDDGRTGTTN